MAKGARESKAKFKLHSVFSETTESYKEIVWGPLILPIFRSIRSATKWLNQWSLSRVIYSAVWIWMLAALLCFSFIAALHVQFGLAIANEGIGWVEYIWDKGVLYLYDISRFHTTWWLIISFVMICIWLMIRPLSVSRLGGWQSRLWLMLFAYSVLFTLSIVLAWQFQQKLLGIQWFFAILVFVICHFLFLFSIGVLVSLSSKVPALNQLYLSDTIAILKNHEQPVEHVFKGSLYGYIVTQAADSFFNRCLGGIFGQLWIYKRVRKFFVQFVHCVSLAWLVDRVFNRPYYVQHFEMVLRWKLSDVSSAAYSSAQENSLQTVLYEYADLHDEQGDEA